MKNLLLTCLLLIGICSCEQTNQKSEKMEKAIKPIEVVQGFFKAINEGNMEVARNFMADDHKYIGPMFSTDNPEDFFKALGAFEMQFEVETQDLIAAENAVTHISILKIIEPVQASIPTCEVFDIKDGKIVRQRFFFDTALFPKP